MIEVLIQLIVLFLVIFDPLASLAVFMAASSNMKKKERKRTALIAISVATGLSVLVILLGENLLKLFSTNLEEFRIAGGIILLILGVKMALGNSLTNLDAVKNNSARAIAAVIGTPLLTGPAAITAILVSINDYGRFATSLAVGIVLVITLIVFLMSEIINKVVGKTAIQVLSTMLGLITLAWGVKYIITGINAILFVY
jgi:multiple antibiotic resistance protein